MSPLWRSAGHLLWRTQIASSVALCCAIRRQGAFLARSSSSFPMLETDLRPLEGLGLSCEDFIHLYNRVEASRGSDPLEFLTSKKTMVKVHRNLGLLENLGMSIGERRCMVMGTDRLFETTPDVLQQHIDFYKRKLDFSDEEVRRFFVSYPDIISQSLGNHIAQRVAIYRVLGLKRKSVRRMALLYPQLFTLKLDDYLLPAMRVVAKAHFSWEQGRRLLKYYPDLVGMQREELKIVFHILKRGGLSPADIISLFRRIAKARLNAPRKYGKVLPAVLWTTFTVESGKKMGVLVTQDAMIWGVSFQKEQIKKLMESKGTDWRPLWEFLESKQLEIQSRQGTNFAAGKELGSEAKSSAGMESGGGADGGVAHGWDVHDAIDNVLSDELFNGERYEVYSDSEGEYDFDMEEGTHEVSTVESTGNSSISDDQGQSHQNELQEGVANVRENVETMFRVGAMEPGVVGTTTQDGGKLGS